MADWGPWVGDVAGAFGSYGVTPGSAAHSKGAFKNDVTDVTRSEGLQILFSWQQAYTTIRTLLFDVGLGSGSEILIANLMHCPPAGGGNTSRAGQRVVYFPVAVPPEQLRMRAQASMASHGIVSTTTNKLVSGLPVVGSIVDTYGADTANTKGTTLTASTDQAQFGSWVQLSPSTNRIKALVLAIGHGQADMTSYTDQYYHLSIGIGAAGFEQEILFFIEAGGSSSVTKTPAPGYIGPLYIDLPEGTRLCARVRKQYSSSLQRTIDLIAYGIR